MTRYLPVMPRLLAAAKLTEAGCLLFERAQDRRGYGRLMVRGRMKAAHRAAWADKHGPIPAGMFVCHRCDIPACINVEHLFLGTPLENMRDMIAKGRDRKDPRRGEQNGRAQVTRIRAGKSWKPEYEEPWS